MYKGLYLFLALLFSGSTVFAQTNDDLKRILKEFDYPTSYQVVSEKMVSGKNDRCLQYEISFKTDYPGIEPGSLVVETLVSIAHPDRTKLKQLPAVIQLPPLGGVNTLDRWMAADFCYRDVASVIIKNDFTGFNQQDAPPKEDHNHAFRRAASAIKSTMAFARDHDRIDGEKVGLFGVSLGGILGSFVYGVEDNVSTGYFVVAGSDVPFILAYSEQKRVKKLRQIRMREENISTQEEYEDFLRGFIAFDPNQTAERVPTDTLRLIISKDDDNVPTVKQYELQDSFGTPETEYYSSGHVGTVINHLVWRSNRVKIIEFYKQRFEQKNPREVRYADASH